MILSEEVLSLLRDDPDVFRSGNEIAARLGVTRNAVWKAIEKLRLEGYNIDAVTNRGYRLLGEADRLSSGAIKTLLSKELSTCFDVIVLPTIDSTNDELRRRAENGAPEGTILLAETQTKGRGRLNRSFYSPKGSGIYMSLLLRPTIPAQASLSITTAAAVAAAEAIESCCGVDARIKWVNDVFVGGKKVSGILTEASINLETGRLDYAVLGIGINITEPEGGWPAPLKEIAAGAAKRGSIVPGLRNTVAAAFIRRFWFYYENLEAKTFLQEYRKRSFVLGTTVTVDDGKTQRPAQALAIDDEFRLIVRFDGEEEGIALSTGEISIRLPDDSAKK